MTGFFVQHPILLAAIVPAIAMVLIISKSTSRNRSNRTFRHRLTMVFTAISLVLLIVGFSRPSVSIKPPTAPGLVLLVDVSESVTDIARERFISRVRELSAAEDSKSGIHDHSRVSLVLFAGDYLRIPESMSSQFMGRRGVEPNIGPVADDLSVEDMILHDRELSQADAALSVLLESKGSLFEIDTIKKRIASLEGFRSQIRPLSTNISSALSYCLDLYSENTPKRIFIFSDMNTTDESLNLISSQIKSHPYADVYFEISDNQGYSDLVAQELTASPDARVNEPFGASLSIRASEHSEGTVSIYVDEQLTETCQYGFQKGANLVQFKGLQLSEGSHVLKAVVESNTDSFKENNWASAYVQVEGKPFVLVLYGKGSNPSMLASGLIAQGFAVDTKWVGDEIALYQLLDYDAVIVFQPESGGLHIQNQVNLDKYVRERGGGVLWVTGCDPLAVSSYSGSIGEQMLPALLPFKSAEVDPTRDPGRNVGPNPSKLPAEAPTLSVILVIDKSGSMDGLKLQLVKESAIATTDALQAEDLLGVIAFDSKSYEIIPLTPAREKDFVASKIGRLVASGETDFYQALASAFEKLSTQESSIKHVILLSDGNTMSANFKELIQKHAAEGITLTTVGIGSDFDSTLLGNLSSWGKGRFYFTSTLQEIPQIFHNETVRILDIARSYRKSSKPKPSSVSEVPPSDDPKLANAFRLEIMDEEVYVLKGLTQDEWPTISDYQSLSPKNGSSTILNASSSPVLVIWRYGLGKTVLWGGDLDGTYSTRLVEWRHFPLLISQIIRFISSQTDIQSLHFTINRQMDRMADKALLRLTVNEEAAGTSVPEKITASLSMKDDERELSPLLISPGQYHIEFPIDSIGSFYYLNFLVTERGYPSANKKYGVILDYSSEHYHRGTSSNEATKSIPRTAGALMTPTAEKMDLRNIFFACALGSFLISIALFVLSNKA